LGTGMRRQKIEMKTEYLKARVVPPGMDKI
jgi:hypothetical protein